MNDIVQLGPEDPGTKFAVAALLGSTLSELKSIESNIVGSSSNIKALKTNVNQIFSQLTTAAPHQQTPSTVISAPVVPIANVVNAGINIQPGTTAIQDDPNQLLFDFNKPITPHTINNKLDTILSKLADIDQRLKQLE
jgi:outer membrane protein OmpA-like peptidoglycan-associated protein